ncbi:MAG: MotA/TolQ/ExbB proton channel family protein, partial [Phycisphaerae bacterium]|nr:MotA/TolQ/ExbB proton channel family protein [Phycisphaerae bacterium]
MMSRKHNHFLFIAAGIFLAITSVAVYAQSDDTDKSLQVAIEQTRRQLTAEKKRIEQELQLQETELKEAEIRQEQLVNEIVDRKFAIANKEVQLEKRRSEREKLRQQQDSFKQQSAEIRIIITDSCQKLSDLLDTLPASESRQEQSKLLFDIKSSLEKTEPLQPDMNPLIKLLASLLQESCTSAVFSQNIRDAQGYEKQVQLLRIGQVLFAYRSPSGQIAIAASASGDEKGFRWNEDIPKWARKEIRFAIKKAVSKSRVYFLPVDVTQQLTTEHNYKSGFWTKLATGGPVMIPLAIVALLASMLIIKKFKFLSEQGDDTVEVAERILAACHAGNFQKAENIAIQNPSVISRTLLSCLSRRLEDKTVMEDAIAESILHELPKIERFLPSIGILAGVAPLLGLLGTVTGMISTFDAIA